jgi:hypothetical protein
MESEAPIPWDTNLTLAFFTFAFLLLPFLRASVSPWFTHSLAVTRYR